MKSFKNKKAEFNFYIDQELEAGIVLEGTEVLHTGIPFQQAMTLFVGTIAAYISGTIALKWLLGVIRRGRLDRFAYYCYTIGVVGLIWFARGFFF